MQQRPDGIVTGLILCGVMLAGCSQAKPGAAIRDSGGDAFYATLPGQPGDTAADIGGDRADVAGDLASDVIAAGPGDTSGPVDAASGVETQNVGSGGAAVGSGGSGGSAGLGTGGAGGAAREPLLPRGPWTATGDNGALPGGALPIGQEGPSILYACRVAHDGGVIGGKAFSWGQCNIAYNGKETTVINPEVLVGALFRWENTRVRLTTVPVQAVISGRDKTGAAAYVCRASYMGGVHPGRLWMGRCTIGFGGYEIGLDAFDTLVSTGP